MQQKQKLLVLVGPTAIGKTELSLSLAKRFNCEIISGDSMQVYRGMNIGTAKLPMTERAYVPHHLLDICDPDDSFTVSDFQTRVRNAIGDIASRGRLPFIVGGTGLYIESVCYHYEFSEAVHDEAYRLQLQQLAAERGNQHVHQLLARIDPVTAKKLHANDLRRVIRALEVFHMTGQTQSEASRQHPKTSPYQLCLLGLTMDRSKLYQRIERRVDEMMESGLLDEVKGLLAQGYDESLTSMQALGYKELIAYIKGEYSFEEAVYRVKRDTRRYAKRQLSWFRHMQDLIWIDVTLRENFSAHEQTISGIISEKLQITE